MKKVLLAVLLLCSFLPAQEALMPIPRQQFFDANGNPLAGGFLFSYVAGTTNPQATFTDSSGLIEQPNPITLDASGSPPNGTQVWLAPTFYKICLQDSQGAQQWCADNVSSYNLPFITNLSFLEGTAPTGVVGSCLIYGIAALHRLAFNCNNQGQDLFVGQNTSDILANKQLQSPIISLPTTTSETTQGTNIHKGTDSFAQINKKCYLDGMANTTLSQAVVCAGSPGTVEIPPIAGTVVVPTSLSIPSGVTLKIDQGAVLSIAAGQILTIGGTFQAGIYQVFSGTGTVNFTSPGNQAEVRPEWWGGKADGSSAYPVTGSDNLAAFNAAMASLPVYPGLPSQGPYTLVNGQQARTGKILLTPGRYVVSNTLLLSPFTSYECPSFNGCFIVLQDGVAASGPELFVINVQALAGPSPNTSYGAQFKDISVECNSNVSAGGHNVKASGVQFNGAQGSGLGTLWIENCGIRGFWLQNSGSNLSGLGATSDLEILGVITGPGIQLDGAVGNFGTLRAEAVNPTGVNVDADGDPNPGLLIGSAGSNGADNINIEVFGAEFDALPMKIWSGNAITIQNTSLGSNPGNPMTTGIIISHGANAVKFGPLFTFNASPQVFTNMIVDRTTSPTTTITSAGNGVGAGTNDFPSIDGYPIIPKRVAAVDLTAQNAAIGTTTLFAVPGQRPGQYRLSWNAKVTTVAGTSSTLGALTIVYTDPDSVVQTITAPASVAAGTIATSSAGNTTGTVLLGIPLMLNCKASTNVTYAFAYASNAANIMAYNLHLKLEAQ